MFILSGEAGVWSNSKAKILWKKFYNDVLLIILIKITQIISTHVITFGILNRK